MSKLSQDVYVELVEELEQTLQGALDEITSYKEGGVSNKAAAARVRKYTSELGKVGKEFRKESVAFHK